MKHENGLPRISSADDSCVLFMQLPSPPGLDVHRDYMGGFGLTTPSRRMRYGGSPHVMPPLFSAYAASILEKRGIRALILDAQVEDLDIPKLSARMQQVSPGIVLARPSLPTVYQDMEVITTLASAHPKTSFVLWGPLCGTMPRDLLKPPVAAAIWGEPESVVLRVVDALLNHQIDDLKDESGVSYRVNDQLMISETRAKPVDLERLPMPAYHLLRMDLYRLEKSRLGDYGDREGRLERFFTVLSSRGCSYGCSYCPYPFGFGSPWRSMSARKTVDEVEALARAHNVEVVWFRDQTWSFDVRRAEDICDAMLRRNLHVRWVCETRADKLTHDLIKKMHLAGCAMAQIGVETGSRRILEDVAKPGYRISQVKQTFQWLREEGITSKAFIIVGLPGESWQTIAETNRFIEELNPDILDATIATPYPGTKLHEEAMEKGWLSKETDWSDYSSISPTMETEDLSSEEARVARDYLMNEFKLRNLPHNIRASFESKDFRRMRGEILTILKRSSATILGRRLAKEMTQDRGKTK